ncbi:MAG: hypothetical protein KKA31_02960 [Candidatus Margulisbacteria bacterium]|nr:hypothetical protein [Candidatus Margulisiibacteriota bacterium]
MRNICLLLITVLLIEIPAIGTTSPQVLSGKEVVWSGEIELKNDVVVPEGTTLKITPGSKIYGSYEQADGTVSPKEWKIIVKGSLIAEDTLIDPMPHGLSAIRIPIDSNIQSIKIAPMKIETQKIKDEFAVFRTQYVVLWALLFGSIYYAIKARKE